MAPYRVPVFNQLARIAGIDLRVLYLAETDPRREWRSYADEMAYSFAVLRERHRIVRDDNWIHLSSGVTREILKFRPDIVLAGGWDQPSYILSYSLRHVFGYGFGMWVESNARDRRRGSPIAEGLKRRMVRGSGAIAVPGRASGAYVASLGAPADRIVVAPNAVDSDYFRARGAVDRSDRSAAPRFLYVGRLHEMKGLGTLLDAWKILRPEAGTLALAGSGPMEAEIAARIASEGIANVEMLGHLQREGLAAEYARADVFVFPSWSDPWGLVLNEAMAAGLPIVSTTVPGAVDDMVVDEDNGLLVAPRDADGLAKALIRLSENADERVAMGLRSLQRIEAFSPAACAAGLAEAARVAAGNR